MRRRIVVLTLLGVLGLAVSCGDDGGGSAGPNLPPTTSILSLELLPEQQYRAHIAWTGDDNGASVSHYEIAWETGQVMLGASLFEDSLTWERVDVTESTFTLNADLCSEAGTCSTNYTFFVRAVDRGGAVDTNPPYRSFRTTTVLPEAWFISPPPGDQTEQPTCLRLMWTGEDTDGEIVEYRYCQKKLWDPPKGLPPVHPYDSRWSEWMTGHSVVVSPVTTTEDWNPWTFFIQAKDNAGAVQQVFDPAKSRSIVSVNPDLIDGPTITIRCYEGPCVGKLGPMIASRSNSNPGNMDVPVEVFAGDTLCIKSYAEPGHFATDLTHMKYTDTPAFPYSWNLSSDSLGWYHPRYPEPFIAPTGEVTIYLHVKDNYCTWGDTATAYIKFNGNPSPAP